MSIRSAPKPATSSDWMDIVSSWPSLPYLQALYFALKNAVHVDIESKALTQTRWEHISKNVADLKPILDDWYAPRPVWYAHDIVCAVEQMVNAKVFVMRKVTETDEGLLFLQSDELNKKQKQHEEEIDTILNKTK